MPEVPDCLNRRYKALDGLIQELNAMTNQESREECCGHKCSKDPGIKLMCDFWDIMKDNPNFDLTDAVKKRLNMSQSSSAIKQRLDCYVAGNCEKRKETINKIKSLCSQCSVKTPITKEYITKCYRSNINTMSSSKDVLPLSKVLGNLKEAASFDKRCNIRVNDLMNTYKDLQVHILMLEQRETEGIKLLKEADSMWASMEEAYKKKVAASLERQKTLLKQLKEVEASKAKWRKNKKTLESQMDTVNKYHKEIQEKLAQKNNDLKYMDVEIADFQKRIENNKKDLAGESKVIANKKQASDKKIASIKEKVARLKQSLGDETDHKYKKEQEGQQYLKEAREDLQKICRVLLEKKLEHEDLLAEKEALENEINLLNQTCDQCQEKCKNKEQYLDEEIKKINKEIGEFQVKCIQCHQCTDTIDARRLCNDCPRCIEARNCLTAEDYCERDSTWDCVCMGVKEKFMDNVFENMYTVLERQSKSPTGKAVADAVMKCLKNSRNGKLNNETRRLLQDFVLNGVKKDLNLTIVGGAVKTRCEMDADTYNQLMLCLKQVKPVKAPKEEKGTEAKKEPCKRWGGTSECHCPSAGTGKPCICMERAPPPATDPNPHPPVYEKLEDEGQMIACPHKESTSCGPDCALHAVPSLVGTEVASWRPDPCSGSACQFSKNMRAAQCVLGPESLNSLPKSFTSPALNVSDLSDTMTCKCGHPTTKPCSCGKDRTLTSHPREIIIEEVLGSYTEVTPIENVSCTMISDSSYEDYADTTELYAENSSDNRGTLWNQETNDFYQGYSLLEKDADHNIVNSLNQAKQEEIVDVSNTPLKTLPIRENYIINEFDGQRRETLDDSYTVNKTTHFSTSVQLLTDMSSGNLVIELEEEAIDLIDKKSAENPNIITTLKKTGSGHFVISFDSVDHADGYVCRILQQRTPSGSRLLEIQKDCINVLTSNDSKNEDKTQDGKNGTTDNIKLKKSIGDMQHQTHRPQVLFDHEKSNVKSVQIQNLCKMLLEQKYQQNRSITVKLKNNTGVYSEMNAPLIKTSSKNVAVNISKSPLCYKLKQTRNERAVFVTKSDSEAIILNLDPDIESPNAVVRSIDSENCLLLLDHSISQAGGSVKVATTPSEKIYKMHIKTPNHDVLEPPAVLKSTTSRSYIIVPDKEFEIGYNQTIHDLLEINTEYSVKLMRIDSDNYVLSFEDSCDGPNALIIKDESGNIHVKKLQDYLAPSDIGRRKTSAEMASKVIDELLKKFPTKSKENISVSSLTQGFATTSKEGNSHPNLHEKIMLFLPDHEKNTTKLAPIIRRVSSGKYDVVLDKQSKEKFMQNLRNYLQNESQGHLSIIKTDTEEIAMLLSSDPTDERHYGVLKITPSEKIFIAVTEKIVTNTTKEPLNVDTTTPSISDSNSEHMIEPNHRSTNKAVTTTCHSKPENCDLSKCVCSEINLEKIDWMVSSSQNDKLFMPPVLQLKSSDIRDPNKWIEQCSHCICSNSSKEQSLPRIVIKPCNCQTVISKKHYKNKQCLYIFEIVCPYQENIRCKSTMPLAEEMVTDKSDWDSLNFLPPQLPDFLQDLKYQ